MAAALPWGKFFWRDWMIELTLRGCSLAARGLWMDMLCIAAQHEPPGYVAVNGSPLDGDSLAKLIGGDKVEVNLLLNELDKAGVFSRDRDTGAIYSRRMVADHAKHMKAVTNGKRGGNPSLGNYETKSRSVNHLDKPVDKPPHKLPVKPQVNVEVISVDNGGVKHRVRDQSTEIRDQKEKNQNQTTTTSTVAAREVEDDDTEKVRKACVAFSAGVMLAFERSGQVRYPDTSLAWEWSKLPGFDFTTALRVVEGELLNTTNKSIGSLDWFKKRILSKHEASQHTHGPGAAPAQVAEPEESSENETGHKGLSPAAARVALKYWEEKRQWHGVNGPRPDEMGCRVPSHILREYGYRDDHGRIPSAELATNYGKLLTHVTKGRETVRNSLTPMMKNGGAHTETVQ